MRIYDHLASYHELSPIQVSDESIQNSMLLLSLRSIYSANKINNPKGITGGLLLHTLQNRVLLYS